MANLLVKLMTALEQLKEEDFKKFKWFLKQEYIFKGHSGISVAQLETADRQDTVDLMAQKYGNTGAMRETIRVLEKISRNDLVQSLQKSCLDPKHFRPQDTERKEAKEAEQQSIQHFPGYVTLDPGAADDVTSPAGGKKVQHGDVMKKLLENPERFFRCVCWTGPKTEKEGTKYTET